MVPLLSLACCLVLSAQAPEARPGADAIAVRGEPELTAAAALASAEARLGEQLRAGWRQRASALAAEAAGWLPQAAVDGVVARWLAATPTAELVRVVDRADRTRDHGFGASWQTTLWYAEDAQLRRRGEAALRAEFAAVRRDCVVRGGAVAGAWATLAFLVGWFDRLTRGYMTGRLRAIGGVLAVAASAAAVLV